MIEVKNLNFKYKGNISALEDINLQVKEGEVVSIIGKNGSGKSTLAKLIAGIIKPSSGEIIIDNINVKDKKEFINLRKICGIVFQNPENQIIFNNVHDDIIFAISNLGLDNKEERVKLALREVRNGGI